MIVDDRIQPFVLPHVRGRMVRLGPALDWILGRHPYPPPVARLLAETVVHTVLLASGLKFDGVFGTQIRGDGPVRLLAADLTPDGTLRGYADFDAAAVDRAHALDRAPVPGLVGDGTLAFTVDQGPHTDRYQSLVALDGPTLTDCLHRYFHESDQVATALRAAVDQDGDGHWHGAALTVQRLPAEQDPGVTEDERDEAWRTAAVLMSSVQPAELARLAPETLVQRLFATEGVRLPAPRGLRGGCRCEAERLLRTLRAFPADQVAAMITDDGTLHATCQFCNTTYRFTPDAVSTEAAALAGAPESFQED